MRIGMQLRWLRAYAVVNTAVVGAALVTAFGHTPGRPRWGEVDVERLNIVEPDGRVRLVISNRAHSPRAVIRGRAYGSPGGTRPGLLFYNDEGTEVGGLLFAGHTVGGRPVAGAGLTFDQHDQDQVVALQYEQDGAQVGAGLTFSERPHAPEDEVLARRDAVARLPAGSARDSAQAAFERAYGGLPYGAQRLVLGRNARGEAVLNLKDRRGVTRLRLVVDSLGAAAIRFLDDSGRATYSIPTTSVGQPGSTTPR